MRTYATGAYPLILIFGASFTMTILRLLARQTRIPGATHGAEVDSDCRQCPLTAALSFYYMYFSTPPIPLVVSSVCVSRCTGVCPVGSFFRGTWFLGVVTRAKRRV